MDQFYENTIADGDTRLILWGPTISQPMPSLLPGYGNNIQRTSESSAMNSEEPKEKLMIIRASSSKLRATSPLFANLFETGGKVPINGNGEMWEMDIHGYTPESFVAFIHRIHGMAPSIRKHRALEVLSEVIMIANQYSCPPHALDIDNWEIKIPQLSSLTDGRHLMMRLHVAWYRREEDTFRTLTKKAIVYSKSYFQHSQRLSPQYQEVLDAMNDKRGSLLRRALTRLIQVARRSEESALCIEDQPSCRKTILNLSRRVCEPRPEDYSESQPYDSHSILRLRDAIFRPLRMKGCNLVAWKWDLDYRCDVRASASMHDVCLFDCLALEWANVHEELIGVAGLEIDSFEAP